MDRRDKAIRVIDRFEPWRDTEAFLRFVTRNGGIRRAAPIEVLEAYALFLVAEERERRACIRRNRRAAA